MQDDWLELDVKRIHISKLLRVVNDLKGEGNDDFMPDSNANSPGSIPNGKRPTRIDTLKPMSPVRKATGTRESINSDLSHYSHFLSTSLGIVKKLKASPHHPH